MRDKPTVNIPETRQMSRRFHRRLMAGLRHSRRVSRLRIVLPVMAGLTILTLFVWPAATGRKLVELPPTLGLPQLSMNQPRFSGTDEQNRPYMVQAERATQVGKSFLEVDLVLPRASLTQADGAMLRGSATTGRFDQAAKRLWLGGDVVLEQPVPGNAVAPALRFATTEAYADLTARTVWGDQPARLSGAFGTIEGQGFRVYDGGKVLLFTGAVRARLNPEGGGIMPTQLFTAPPSQ